jgi:elongation factor P
MISSNDFKRGTVIKLDGTLFSVVEFLHVKPGKGGAFVRTKLKNLVKGTVVEKTFRAGEKVEDVRVERRPMQYLYDEGDSVVFMDQETYDQEHISKDVIGDVLKFLKEEDVVDISMHEGSPVSIDPPESVVLKVTYAEPGVKGDTATNVQKPVKVETGAEVKVPLFINEGDFIKINTQSGEYMERVKK